MSAKVVHRQVYCVECGYVFAEATNEEKMPLHVREGVQHPKDHVATIALRVSVDGSGFVTLSPNMPNVDAAMEREHRR